MEEIRSCCRSSGWGLVLAVVIACGGFGCGGGPAPSAVHSDGGGDGPPDIAAGGDGAADASTSDDASARDLGPVPDGPPSATVNFIVASTFETRARHTIDGVVIGLGDFDGDGKKDIAAVDGDGLAGVFLNRGAGAFQGKLDRFIGAREIAQDIEVADLNGDGKTDLAVTVPSNWTVAILLNQGDGTLVATIPASPGFLPASLSVGDLNSDGKPDLVILDPQLDLVAVMMNKGDGSFDAPVFYPVPPNGSASALGDLDGDGKLDVVVANGRSNCVTVRLNKGDGTLASSNCYHSGGVSPWSVVVGDLSGDGKADLIAGGYETEAIAVLENNGAGVFPVVREYQTAPRSRRLAVGDLNGDGKLDVAVGSASLTVSVFMNRGSAGLAPRVGYLPSGPPQHLAIADVTGDGKADLITSGELTGRVSVLENTGDGTLRSASVHEGTGKEIVVADVDADGKPDLTLFGDAILVLPNRGGGKFGGPVTSVGGPTWVAVKAGDLNRDGRLDLVAVDRQTKAAVFLGAGGGSYAPAVTYSAAAGPYSVAIGDLNGDGNPDLAAMNWGVGPAAGRPAIPSSVSIMMNGGDGTFAPAVDVRPGLPGKVVAIADFNGDGKDDIAAAGDGTVSTLINKGDGTFPLVDVTSPSGTMPMAVTVGDLNRDGKPDLALAGVAGLGVLISRGDGTFVHSDSHAFPTNRTTVVIGDLNRDGWPDLAVSDVHLQFGVKVFLNKGNGTFFDAFTHSAGQSIAIGDLNGDGWPDLTATGGGGVSVILNGGR